MIVSICILGFVFSFRATFGVLLAPTVFRAVSTSSTIPTFNRILALVFALVPVLSVLSLLSLLSFAFAFSFAFSVLAFALLALAFAKCTNVHWSSPLGCDKPFCLTFRAA